MGTKVLDGNDYLSKIIMNLSLFCRKWYIFIVWFWTNDGNFFQQWCVYITFCPHHYYYVEHALKPYGWQQNHESTSIMQKKRHWFIVWPCTNGAWPSCILLTMQCAKYLPLCMNPAWFATAWNTVLLISMMKQARMKYSWFWNYHKFCVKIPKTFPANMRHRRNVGLFLVHRQRRWPNSKPTFAGDRYNKHITKFSLHSIKTI